MDLGTPIFVDVASGPVSVRMEYTAEEYVQRDEPQQVESERSETQETSGLEVCKNEDFPAEDLLIIQKRRIRCQECLRYTAETEEKMLRHIRKVHRGENPFQCYMCDYSTYNKCLFEEHVRIHQGIKPFKCAHCDYRSASKKNVKKHESIHRPDNPLRCADCDFIARNQRSLKNHRVTAHGPSAAEDTCRSAETAAKRKTMKKYRCKQCSFVVDNQKQLIRHKALKHGSNKKETFNCALCKWSSNTRTRILLHLIHHPGQTVDESAVDITVLRQCGIMK